MLDITPGADQTNSSMGVTAMPTAELETIIMSLNEVADRFETSAETLSLIEQRLFRAVDNVESPSVKGNTIADAQPTYSDKLHNILGRLRAADEQSTVTIGNIQRFL